MVRIPEGASPDIKNKSWSVKAEVEVKENASGIIVTQGGLFGGWGLYLNQGKPVFHYNFVDVARFDVAGKESLAPGKHTVEMQFAYDGGGIGRGGVATVSVDGSPVANGRVERTIPIRITLDETLDIGEDCGTPVNLTYDVPFRFEGEIENVTIELP
jgi:arylsulfatase